MSGSRAGSSVNGFLRVVLLLIVAFSFCQQEPVGNASSGGSRPVPRIGILSIRPLPADSPSNRDDPQLLRKYRDAVSSWGAEIVPLTPSDSASETAGRLQRIDGLLIPGGEDIDPLLYGERPHPKLEKVNRVFDEFELAALGTAEKRGIPILGICRGHQIMNVFRGGTLWQDIPAQAASESSLLHRMRIDGRSALCTHTIRLEPESIIAELLSSPTVDVNSYHHQAVKKLGDGLRITASSADGIVEAIETTSGPFFTGVQFHPEKMLPERAEFGHLFETFVDAARRFRAIEEDLH